jgi:hypothetical protein
MLGAATAWPSLTSGETLLLNGPMSCGGGPESKVARVLFALSFALCGLTGPAKAASPEVELYTLDCGRIDVPDMDPFAADGSYMGVTAQLVVPCYLIRNEKQYILWDGRYR